MSQTKMLLSTAYAAWLRSTTAFRRRAMRIAAHAHLAASIQHRVPASVVVLGKAHVHGSGNIHFGQHLLLYPDLYFETQESGRIVIGDGVVISTGTHLVAMDSIEIGAGSMIGEYASIRDANHVRSADGPLRNSGHAADRIVIGREVWIGRGVAVLKGVTIGDGATVGANAVVTRNIAAGATVVGVPAKSLFR